MDLLAVGVAEDLEDAFFLELIGIPQRVGARRRATCDRHNQVGLADETQDPWHGAIGDAHQLDNIEERH